MTASDAVAILEACPDQEWRTLFALCRYGGLRCPSEVVKLRWSDIAWDRDRFKVRAPKTERYGKGERIVPLFPELRQELEMLQELSETTSHGSKIDQFVIRRYRDREANLRSTLLKILDAAGVPRFAKPFMNCRTSRRNELELQGVRNAALNAWFGHSRKTAERHYERVTEDDFASVSSAVGQLVGQSLGNLVTAAAITDFENPVKSGLLTPGEDTGGRAQHTRQDSNLQPSVPKTDALSNCATGASAGCLSRARRVSTF